MTARLIDDRLLLKVLLDADTADVPGAAGGGADVVATTGLWYHRLCRALASSRVIGSLSKLLGEVPVDVADMAMGRVIELPNDIELVSLRTLGWPMARRLHDGARLNLLSLEALAAAQHLGAEIWLDEGGSNRPLMDAAERLGIAVHLVGP